MKIGSKRLPDTIFVPVYTQMVQAPPFPVRNSNYLRLSSGCAKALSAGRDEIERYKKQLEQVFEENSSIKRHTIAGILAANVMGAYDRIQLKTLKQNITTALAALLKYKRLNGEYPHELSDLAPDLIEAVPENPFTGEQLRYEDEGGNKALYGYPPESFVSRTRKYKVELP